MFMSVPIPIRYLNPITKAQSNSLSRIVFLQHIVNIVVGWLTLLLRIFGRTRVQILAQRPGILFEVNCGFPQTVQQMPE
jgi:hypothetical protein